MMRLQTVICELNPIHLGHQSVFDRAAADSDVVAAVMSGNFTQRGEPAVFDKYVRARSAVLAGCDLVFELPYPWCCAGVEGFALGGVTIAAGVLSDGLVFGSETGDFNYIERIAEVKDSPVFAEAVRKAEGNAREVGHAVIFDRVLRGFGIAEMPGANDKLAAEYVRFGRGRLAFTAVKRRTDVRSASQLRAMDFAECAPFLPKSAFEELRGAIRCNYEAFAEILFRHARLYLGGTDHPVLQIAAKKARAVTDAGDFLQTLATKTYTGARMRRELLFSVTGVREEWLKTEPEYAILLAANERGRAYLAENRRNFVVPVIAKPADVPLTEQRKCHIFADELYCLINHLSVDSYLKRHPEIL